MTLWSRWGVRFLLTAIVTVPLLLHVAEYINLKFLPRIEQLAYDLRLRATMPKGQDPRVVIVDLDEESLLAEGQWPWPREKVARLLDRLFDQYGVKVAAFDMVFAEPDRSSGLPVLEELGSTTFRGDAHYQEQLNDLRVRLNWDARLAEAMRSRQVVLGYIFRADAQSSSVGALPPPLFRQGEHNTHLEYYLPEAFTANLADLQQAAGHGGFFDNPAVSKDGVFRRTPLLQKFNGALYPSLALETARAALGDAELKFIFFSGDQGKRDDLDLDWLELAGKRIPVDRNAAVLVPYRGREGSFPYVSAADVLHGRAAQYPLRNSIALIGTSVPGMKDLRVTPVGEAYNGVEIHANIISGILDGRIRHHPRYVQGIEFVNLLLIAGLMTWAMARYKVGKTLLFSVIFLGLQILFNVYMWSAHNFALPLASAITLIFLLYLIHMTYGFFAETRGHRAIANLFGQYVPPELVREMSRNPEAFSMASESREMSVLFSDVRDFTQIAENLKPSEVSELMNEFLTAITEIVYRHRGTIDKYIGDAVMAFWGAPLRDRDHARHALTAALEMQGAIQALVPRLKERNWPEIRIGIGVNSGTMNVGNMGSKFRMAYTVMGDAVNLASRLQGLTAHYGVATAVGEGTAKTLEDFIFLELDRVRVMGKDKAVSVYEPLGKKVEIDGRTAGMVAQHEDALRRYRAQEWDRAEGLFFALQQNFPHKKLFQLYLDRIAYNRVHDVPPGWDGTVVHHRK